MDLLLLHDRIGGRIKEGGVVFPRFIKPNRRQRGTEEEGAKDLSDTFLSSVGTRMLMNGQPSARTKPVNYNITAASCDQNPFFLVQFSDPSHERSQPQPQTPPRSVRSLYQDRVRQEVQRVAGRAQLEHIGSGHAVLMDCTPRFTK